MARQMPSYTYGMATLGETISDLMAGETLTATVSPVGAVTTAGCSLRYTFRTESARVTVHAVTTGVSGQWTVTVPASQTRNLEPGDCLYTGMHTTAAGVVSAVDSGAFLVAANPSIRSRSEVTLEAIRAAIEGRATSEQVTISLGDVTLQHMTPAELGKWETIYASRVRNEMDRQRRDRGLGSRYRIGTRFTE